MSQTVSCLSKAALVAACLLGAADSAGAVPIAAPGTEGLSVIVGTTGTVTATYQGNTASFTNLLYLQNTNSAVIFNNQASPVGGTVTLGTFTAGTELTFRMYVTNTGYDFFTGSGSGNSDGHAHARVQEEYRPGTTLVSFEDLLGGAFDYNDLSFTLNVSASAADFALSAVPEPATLALLGTALAGLVVRRRRR